MNRIIILIILTINLFSCKSQVDKKISNFEKLTRIENQLKNHLTNDKTYKSLDSLKSVVDGADAEFYIEIYKNAILNDTDALLNYLKKNKKNIDENVITFFEQDEYIYSLINKKLNRSNKGNKNLIKNNLISSWQILCEDNESAVIVSDYSLGYLDIYINEELARLSVNIDNNLNFSYSSLTGITIHNEFLEWNEISQDSIIFKIESLHSQSIKLDWYGFYNKSTGKREMTKNPFTNTEEKTVILKRCE